MHRLRIISDLSVKVRRLCAPHIPAPGPAASTRMPIQRQRVRAAGVESAHVIIFGRKVLKAIDFRDGAVLVVVRGQSGDARKRKSYSLPRPPIQTRAATVVLVIVHRSSLILAAVASAEGDGAIIVRDRTS